MPKKICTSCDEHKWVTEYHKDSKARDGRRAMCKLCVLEKYRKSGNERSKASRLEKRIFILNFLQENPCIDCGEGDPVVLEFDHQRDKFENVSRMINGGWGLKKVKEELEKCEIVCANCHRRRTAKTYNYYKHLTESS